MNRIAVDGKHLLQQLILLPYRYVLAIGVQVQVYRHLVMLLPLSNPYPSRITTAKKNTLHMKTQDMRRKYKTQKYIKIHEKTLKAKCRIKAETLCFRVSVVSVRDSGCLSQCPETATMLM